MLLVSALLFFSQHAMAQQPACSASEIATANLLRQNYLACVQQWGVNGFYGLHASNGSQLQRGDISKLPGGNEYRE